MINNNTNDFSRSISTDIFYNKDARTNDLDSRFLPNEAKVIMVNTSNDGISVKNVLTVDIDGENRSKLLTDAFMPDWE